VITLRDLYESGIVATPMMQMLYTMLSERSPSENISHKVMPSMPEHMKFVNSRPYKEWWLICVGEDAVGAIYLSKQNEIGVGILRRVRRLGYGQAAIRAMMERHPGERLAANINPENHRSIHIFKKLGFKHVQATLEWVR